jgi:hypothetical protein
VDKPIDKKSEKKVREDNRSKSKIREKSAAKPK